MTHRQVVEKRYFGIHVDTEEERRGLEEAGNPRGESVSLFFTAYLGTINIGRVKGTKIFVARAARSMCRSVRWCHRLLTLDVIDD